MTAQDLKNSILQLAMQGKLVPQAPNEEPASELLKRIKTEKSKLIKEGRIRKEKSQPPISENEIPFDIPESWGWSRLSEISYLVGTKENQILASEVKLEGRIPAVSQGQRLIDGYCDHVEKTINNLPIILFGDHTRNVKYIDFPFVVSADGTKLLKAIRIDSFYLYYWIMQSSEQIRNRGYARHFSLLKNNPIPIPPFEEQKRIVAKIVGLLPLIERYDESEKRLLELNKKFPDELRKSILQQAVQGKLTEQDPYDEPASVLFHRVIKTNGLKEISVSNDDIPFDIPETWKWVKLGSLCNYGSCENIEAKNIPTNFWILDLEDIEKDTGRVLSRKSSDSYTTKSTKHVFHSGNVLYSKLRPYLNKVVVAEDDGCCTSEILPLDFGEILPRYAQLCLMSPYFISYVNSCSYGVKMPRLGTKDGKNAMFPLAPIQEQARIVARVEELLPLCDSLK